MIRICPHGLSLIQLYWDAAPKKLERLSPSPLPMGKKIVRLCIFPRKRSCQVSLSGGGAYRTASVKCAARGKATPASGRDLFGDRRCPVRGWGYRGSQRWVPDHHCLDRLIGAGIHFLVGNIGRDIDKIAGAGLRNVFQMLAPEKSRAPTHDVEDGFKLAVMMGPAGDCGSNHDRSRPQLACARVRVSDGRRAGHAGRLRRVRVQFARAHNTNAVFFPVGHASAFFVTRPVDGQHKILGVVIAHIAYSMLIVGSDKSHRTRSRFGALSLDGDLQRALPDEKHLFMRVVVGRVRPIARSQVRFVDLDSAVLMREPVKNRTRSIGFAMMHGQLGKFLNF